MSPQGRYSLAQAQVTFWTVLVLTSSFRNICPSFLRPKPRLSASFRLYLLKFGRFWELLSRRQCFRASSNRNRRRRFGLRFFLIAAIYNMELKVA
jgi:hypothetical protein